MHIHGIGVGNNVGAAIFFSFIGLGLLIALYLLFIRKDEKPGVDKH